MKFSAAAVEKEVKKLGNPKKALGVARFFKTGKGEYAEGDVFVGATVPEIRALAKHYQALPYEEIVALLHSRLHEVRLFALILLVDQFKKGDEQLKKKIFTLYISSATFINNWDLVDLSAEHIVGGYLNQRSRKPLEKLAKSKNIWERRMAMVGTFHFIKQGQADDALKIAELLLKDQHDLLQKASGWMLREVGKRCKPGTLEKFLDQHAGTMPRTMLRYAIERFSEEKRLRYLLSRKALANALDPERRRRI